ncbi:MAG: hypothetical protein HZB51_19435 [Chloroflexi bacterium]|nr:hypothetical protein [Chloroflexota bacterium]
MSQLKNIAYGGWENCLRLSDDDLELVITLDVGPRIIRLGTPGGQNLFKEFDDQMGKTSGTEWMSFGGHRLWHAPEVFPRTYAPDFQSVDHTWKDNVLKMVQKTEPETGIQKEIEICIQNKTVHLVHRLINRNSWAVELAPWCLSVMAAGGRVLVPQEDFIPHPDVLTPARPLVLWHFTRMNDPRFTWGDRLIQMREDSQIDSKQKFGVRNTKGWAAYQLGQELFLKLVPPSMPGAIYPDMGCNLEFFTMPGFLEVESLGPLVKLEPNAATEHVEQWRLLSRIELPSEEKPLIDALNPYLRDMGLPAILN